MSAVLYILKMSLAEMDDDSFVATAEKIAQVLDAMVQEPLENAYVTKEMLESARLVLKSAIERLTRGVR